jgi:Bacterial dipeptidyl-peptidase Sh3 domain/Variant SH3 domain
MDHSNLRGLRSTVSSRIVSVDHNASYLNPINVAKAEHIVLTGREDIWDGHRWLWAVANDGREGWVPDSLISEVDGQHAVKRDFSAIELSCVVGETVEVIWQTHGWAWCQMRDGGEGWLPVNKLSRTSPRHCTGRRA